MTAKSKALRANNDSILKIDFSEKGKRHRTPALQRILAMTAEPSGPCGCTLWTGATITTNGYPTIGSDTPGKKVRPSRLLLENKIGRRLRKGEFALHNPEVCSQDRRCVNPDHLMVGSLKQNSAHAKASGTLTKPRLRAAQVEKIADLIEVGTDFRKIADKYGVCPQAIHRIAQGRTWSKITGIVFQPKPVGRPRKATAPKSNRQPSKQMEAVAI